MSGAMGVAIEAVRKAAAVQRRFYGSAVHVARKADSTPVTRVDRLSERAILSTLRREYPDASYLSEESGRVAGRSGEEWIVDPMDGTKNFVRGVPLFGPLVALMARGRLAVAALALPCLGELMWAERGKGTFLNGRRVRVSAESRLERAFLTDGGFGRFRETSTLAAHLALASACRRERGYGDLFGYYLVAKGAADIMAEPFPAPWDIAAPALLVEEAGGRFSDLSGKTVLDSKNLAVASNGRLHGAALAVLRRAMQTGEKPSDG